MYDKGFSKIAKTITFILSAQLLPFVLMGQTKWEEYLVHERYYKWDSIQCNQFYSIADSNHVFSSPDQIIEIIGIEKLENVNHPNVPEMFKLQGKVYFMFVVTKENKV